ncbi:MAG: hypothetical protein ACYDCK_06430 [Thermoplasmatota archaeon]
MAFLVLAFPLASAAGPTDPACVTVTTGHDAPRGLPQVSPFYTSDEVGVAAGANLVITGAFASALVHPGVCAAEPSLARIGPPLVGLP